MRSEVITETVAVGKAAGRVGDGVRNSISDAQAQSSNKEERKRCWFVMKGILANLDRYNWTRCVLVLIAKRQRR